MMHQACGDPKVIRNGLTDTHNRLTSNDPAMREHIGHLVGTTDNAVIDAHIATLATRTGTALAQLATEPSHLDAHYVSRFDAVGLFQSALGKIFSDIPGFQGYGDKNPIWLTTLIEGVEHEIKFFFEKVYQDVDGNKQPLWQALLTELHRLPQESFKAPFPLGTPATIPIPNDAIIVLLADWGGDNDAAKNIATIARKHHPVMGIHLGDVYYGGTKEECETFLRLWPIQDKGGNIPPGSSLALNGNHEMYCGGEYYFDIILKAFGQPQSFFCLENDHWRIIGLDTAYNDGTLKPKSNDDPVRVQWDWLTNLFKNPNGKRTILLSHHQPVSAHKPEFEASRALYTEITELCATEGIGQDAIFGWFFGHEHRCALYQDDTTTPFNARLIGNACIPHLVQHEKAADDGCTPIAYVNRREIHPGDNVAVSSFAKLSFGGAELIIDYINEDNTTWGTEAWHAEKGRLDGVPFQEYDGLQ